MALYWLLAANAIIGLLLFELSWKMTARLRVPNEERDKNFPTRRRYDITTPQKWRFYFGAMTFLIPRLVIMFGNILIVWVVCL